jgi:hypothetical protein
MAHARAGTADAGSKGNLPFADTKKATLVVAAVRDTRASSKFLPRQIGDHPFAKICRTRREPPVAGNGRDCGLLARGHGAFLAKGPLAVQLNIFCQK